MSFLTRSKLNLSESSSTLFSRLDDKSKIIPAPQQRQGLMTSLDDFRQGLRRQLTDKLKTSPSETNGSTKFVAIPSPKRNQTSVKDLFENTLGNKQKASPSKGGINASGRSTSALAPKPFERKHDFVKELTKKLDDRSSPHRRMPSKDLSLFTSLDRKANGQSAILSSGYRSSFDKREKSPLKEYASALDLKSPNSRSTPYGMRSSFLNERPISHTPKEMKKSLIKILDHDTTPKRESPSKLNSDRSSGTLAQQLNQLRSSRIVLQPHTPEKRQETNYTSNRYSTDNLKTLSSFVNESFKLKDRERSAERYGAKKTNLYTSTSDLGASHHDRSALTEKLSISKIYEIQDMFYNVSDKDFNHLPSDYVEELIKLSSVIMQKVKGSSYYGRE